MWKPGLMSVTVKIRKVHIDYAGADGLPKPMNWAFAAKEAWEKADYERKARDIFHERFPEWNLRSCAVTETDLEVAETRLQPVPGEAGVWLLG